jgi:hypothetical protein
MKAFILTIFCALLFGTMANAQCNADALAGDCNAKLGDFTVSLNFLMYSVKTPNTLFLSVMAKAVRLKLRSA